MNLPETHAQALESELKIELGSEGDHCACMDCRECGECVACGDCACDEPTVVASFDCERHPVDCERHPVELAPA